MRQQGHNLYFSPHLQVYQLKSQLSSLEMLQLQSKTFATITNKLEANVKGEVISRPKVDVSIGKNVFKIANLRAIRDYEVITNTKFKIRVKDLLDF